MMRRDGDPCGERGEILAERMVVDAVWSEPVSAANSLLSGDLQGIRRVFALDANAFAENCGDFSMT
jgi:hypothetical protein